MTEKKPIEWFVKHAMPDELCIAIVAVEEHKNNPKDGCGCAFCQSKIKKEQRVK